MSKLAELKMQPVGKAYNAEAVGVEITPEMNIFGKDKIVASLAIYGGITPKVLPVELKDGTILYQVTKSTVAKVLEGMGIQYPFFSQLLNPK